MSRGIFYQPGCSTNLELEQCVLSKQYSKENWKLDT